MWRAQIDCSQTIFALTTGTLPTAVAIVKLSGPDAFAIAAKIFFPLNGTPLKRERAAVFGEVKCPRTFRKIDDALAVAFVGPHSFSGEDTVEFQLHGSL